MQSLKADTKKIYADDVPFGAELVTDENVHLKKIVVIMASLKAISIVSTVVLIIALLIVITRPPVTLSYAVDANGRIVEITPVSQPYSYSRVSGFAAKKVEQAFHLSFTDLDDHLLEVSKFFTPAGFIAFKSQLIEKGWISQIQNDDLTMWSEIRTAPKFLQDEPVNDVYQYELAFDIDLFIGGGKSLYSPTRLEVRVVVIRSVENHEGLKIKRILLGEVKS